MRGDWRKLHVMYPSQSISGVIKSRRMRWVWHVALVGAKETHNILVHNQKERNSLIKAGRRREDNIKRNLKEILGGRGYWSGPGYGHFSGLCEKGNELSVSTKCGVFLDKERNLLSSEEGPCFTKSIFWLFT